MLFMFCVNRIWHEKKNREKNDPANVPQSQSSQCLASRIPIQKIVAEKITWNKRKTAHNQGFSKSALNIFDCKITTALSTKTPSAKPNKDNKNIENINWNNDILCSVLLISSALKNCLNCDKRNFVSAVEIYYSII